MLENFIVRDLRHIGFVSNNYVVTDWFFDPDTTADAVVRKLYKDYNNDTSRYGSIYDFVNGLVFTHASQAEIREIKRRITLTYKSMEEIY